MKPVKLFIIAGLILSLAACSKWWDDEEANNPFRGMSAEQLYKEAEQSMEKKQYTSAAKRYEALDSMYPFNDYAEKAQLRLIYAYYMDEAYPSSAATAERFIHLYPRSKRVDYAYYMKGMANFQQSRGTFAKWLPLDESRRDPGSQSLAYSDFSTLVQKFPNSEYKANAQQRLIFLRNMFAEREYHAARYYFQRKMYVAAVGRADFLVKNYPQAPSAREALLIMRDANLALGLNQAADEAVAAYESTYHQKPGRLNLAAS